jgi:hypothetical protein
MKRVLRSISALVMASALFAVACGGDDDDDGGGGGNTPAPRPEDTGAACTTADECYPTVAEGALQGDAQCLEEVRDGYCTHSCEADEDCCAAEGECDNDLAQVCSPFTSTSGMKCFLSCEDEDVAAHPDVVYEDENEYCQREASRDFICRSSGGGDENRKICVPGDCGVGADCATNEHCTGDLECVTSFGGGYCTRSGCASNDDCPTDSLCVARGEQNYCYKTCQAASDCSFCRGEGVFAACSAEVTFVQDGTSGTVCVPP